MLVVNPAVVHRILDGVVGGVEDRLARKCVIGSGRGRNAGRESSPQSGNAGVGLAHKRGGLHRHRTALDHECEVRLQFRPCCVAGHAAERIVQRFTHALAVFIAPPRVIVDFGGDRAAVYHVSLEHRRARRAGLGPGSVLARLVANLTEGATERCDGAARARQHFGAFHRRFERATDIALQGDSALRALRRARAQCAYIRELRHQSAILFEESRGRAGENVGGSAEQSPVCAKPGVARPHVSDQQGALAREPDIERLRRRPTGRLDAGVQLIQRPRLSLGCQPARQPLNCRPGRTTTGRRSESLEAADCVGRALFLLAETTLAGREFLAGADFELPGVGLGGCGLRLSLSLGDTALP